MYSLNGIPLHDPTRDWVLRSGTAPLVNISIERARLSIAGRDGNVPLPGAAVEPKFPLVIQTPRANLETLRRLLRVQDAHLTETAHPEREAIVQLDSLSPAGFGDADEIVDVTAIYGIPAVYWRDTVAITSDPVALTTGSVNVDVLSTLSAPVRDAIVRLKGGLIGAKVLDAGGSYFRHTAELPDGSYLRFESESGRAWVTATDTWTGGTEVTGDVETGPGPYFLELSPYFTDNPAECTAHLTVTSTSRSGSPAIEVRAKRAYEV